MHIRFLTLLPLALCSGCAGLHFNGGRSDDALTYYEPVPFAAVKIAADCSASVDVVILPGKARSVAFHSGFGSAKLGVTLSGGMITQVNQETDTKIPETLTAVAGLAKAATGVGAALNPAGGGSPGVVAPPAPKCAPGVKLYQIVVDQAGHVTTDSLATLSYAAVQAQEDLAIPDASAIPVQPDASKGAPVGPPKLPVKPPVPD